MSAQTATFQYRILRNPTEDDVNRLGAAGWRLHKIGLDPRDGALSYVVMEYSDAAVLIDAAQGILSMDADLTDEQAETIRQDFEKTAHKEVKIGRRR